MKSAIPLTLVMLLTAPLVQADVPDRAVLVSSPRHVENAREPHFSDLSPEALEHGTKVISSRSSAVFGFNTPEVQIHLPRCDNNVYAGVDFSDASLVDATGNAVAYERERGIYDHELFLDELRFAPADDSRTLVDFARAKGAITLHYPTRMRTVSIAPGGEAPKGLRVTIDGPFVTWSDPDSMLPEASAFAPFQQLRAYDRAGKQLEMDSNKGFSMVNGVSSETLAFWGEVAELKVDLVDDWVTLAISYDLPPVAALPMTQAGTPQELQKKVAPTPGGKVVITRVRQARPTTLEAVPTSSLSPQEALAKLKPFGIRSVDASALVMATMHGKAEAVKILLAAGAPIEGRHVGMTALLAAAMYGKAEIGLQLIAAGADVNAADDNGSTPLLDAAMKCSATPLVKALIEAGADVNAVAKGGGKPLMMANALKCTDNAALLRAAGAHE